jgi:hypothetical protein
VALAFINHRRLSLLPRAPKLTTDGLGLLIFRNVMKDVAELQKDPIPGVEIFSHLSARLASCRLPRPVYVRLSGPALEGTAWEGTEVFVRVQCNLRYPVEPPRLDFVPPIFHPLVDENGCVFPEAIPGAQKGIRGARVGECEVLPTIRRVIQDLVDRSPRGMLAHPEANMKDVVNVEAVYAITQDFTLQTYLEMARSQQETRLKSLRENVEPLFERYKNRMEADDRELVRRALETNTMLWGAMKALDHYVNGDVVMSSGERDDPQ